MNDVPSTLEGAWLISGLTLEDLWVDYFGLGGTKGPEVVRLYLTGNIGPTPYEHDLIAVAINEHCRAVGRGTPVEYWQ